MRAPSGQVTGRHDPHRADAPHDWTATLPTQRPESRQVPVPRGAVPERRQGTGAASSRTCSSRRVPASKRDPIRVRPVPRSASGSREDHWWIESLPTRAPRDPRAVTRTLLILGYRFGPTTPGSRPLLPGRRMGCRMQLSATDRPASSWPVRHFRRPVTDHVPTVDLLCTSRDGTDDGERSKGTVTYAVPMTSRRRKASFTPC
jgi:hypothetical protein